MGARRLRGQQRPLARMLGIAGRIGRENSLRSPRRMAQTAAALIVGLAAASWPARRAARLDVLTALSAE